MSGPLLVHLTADELRAIVREELRAVASPSVSTDREVLTRAQVAELLQVHPNVIPRYVRALGLPSHKTGGEYRFLRSEVMAWIQQRKGAA